MQIPILTDIVIIFCLAVVVLLVCYRLKIPAIIGYLLTGIVAGPYGLKLIHAVHEVEVVAELGVILLLFTIGIEFSVTNLLRIWKTVLFGGGLQVGLTTVVTAAAAIGFGRPLGEAVFAGFLVSLSSTAIVLKLLQERAEVDSPHGRTCVGVLIFQDLAVVPMMLAAPVLAGVAENVWGFVLLTLGKCVLIGIVVYALARFIVPALFFRVVKTRSRELFLLCVVSVCFAVAVLTSLAGLSLALGAFVAGLIISESEYNHQAVGNILPFRDVFASLFFVSIGMLLDVGSVFREPMIIGLCAAGVLLLKAVTAGGVTALLGMPLRTVILVAFSLCQVGEFSFILARTGATVGLMADAEQLFLATAILTMAATPFLTAAAPAAASALSRLPLSKRLKTGLSTIDRPPIETRRHLVIIGYGISGKNLSRGARAAGIPYMIVEMNPETVRTEREKGEPIFFGDAAHDAVLAHAHITEARIAVVAINDPAATRRIVQAIREANPSIHLIARTRFLKELKPLRDLGADDVIPEEFETAVEIFSRVLNKYLVPRDQIDRLTNEIRADGYGMLRNPAPQWTNLKAIDGAFGEEEMVALRVCEGSEMAGKTLAETDLRNQTGLTVLAIRRTDQMTTNPKGAERVKAEDELIVWGKSVSITQARVRFFDPCSAEKTTL